MRARRRTKELLAVLRHLDRAPARGATILIYHRVGGGSSDELDVDRAAFAQHLELLVSPRYEVISLDLALDRLKAGDDSPAVVLTFDDGFADVYHHAFPVLRELQLPFTLYLAAGLVGGEMTWEGSSSTSQGSAAITWSEVEEMQASRLCTVANHTHTHAGPNEVGIAELDRCSDAIEAHLGTRPTHFAWTWGVPVPHLLPEVRSRFRSVATGEIGRNLPGDDLHSLRRVPVRASDPQPFFEAKLTGRLWPERAYAALVAAAKVTKRSNRHG